MTTQEQLNAISCETDIVIRLRRTARGIVGIDQDRVEAADEIERLRNAMDDNLSGINKTLQEGEWNEYTGAILLSEGQAEIIRASVVEMMVALKQE